MNNYRGISKREALRDVCRLDQTWDEPPVDEREDDDPDPQDPEGTTLGPTTVRADVQVCRLCGDVIGQTLIDICTSCELEHDARYLSWLDEQEHAWLRDQRRSS